MKCDILVNAIGCIDGAFIDEAENYKPKRKMPAWIWAASAACVCVFVLFAAWFNDFFTTDCEATLMIVSGANAKNGYINYRERAEMGKVLITDELLRSMSENAESKCHAVEFSVRITDANGSAVPLDCLSAIKLGDAERTDFAISGCVQLSRKEIYAVKGVPGFALIISPDYLGITEEFLNTVDRDMIDVWVSVKFDDKFLKEHEYIEEYDRLDRETRYKLIEEQVTRFFKEKHYVSIELDDEFKKFLEEYDSLDSENRHRHFVKQISRLLYLKYEEFDIDGDPIKGYMGGIDLGAEFREFLREEHVHGYLAEFAGGYGFNVESIKEYRDPRSTWIAFNAELDTETIAEILRDERTYAVNIMGIL